jgi:CysZ protein
MRAAKTAAWRDICPHDKSARGAAEGSIQPEGARSMIGDFTRGARYALGGFTTVRQPGVLPYAVLPLLVNAVLFGAGIWFAAGAFADFMAWLLPEWLDVQLIRVLLWMLFAVSVALMLFYLFTLVANLVAAPVNGLLAARVEQYVRGAVGPEGRQRSLVAEVGASFGAEIRKLIYLACWAIPLLLLFLVPGINLLMPPLWLAFGAWMMALEYVDCPLGNHGVVFHEGRALIARRRAVALGFGAVIMAMTAVPGLNLIAMPVAIGGATRLYTQELAPLLAADEH